MWQSPQGIKGFASSPQATNLRCSSVGIFACFFNLTIPKPVAELKKGFLLRQKWEGGERWRGCAPQRRAAGQCQDTASERSVGIRRGPPARCAPLLSLGAARRDFRQSVRVNNGVHRGGGWGMGKASGEELGLPVFNVPLRGGVGSCSIQSRQLVQTLSK